jgi:hypothetical protein
MLKTLVNLFRSKPPPVAETPVEQPAAPATASKAPETSFRNHDDAAWEKYHDSRDIASSYSWTYNGTTVQYRELSWQFHEPDTFRPKAVRERFYNELSPQHVNQLLEKWDTAEQKRRAREQLAQAAQVAYMRRKHSGEARSLADLLTQQSIEVYPKRCSGRVFEWRAKLLLEQGLAANAIQLLTQRLDMCRDEPERERLLKAPAGCSVADHQNRHDGFSFPPTAWPIITKM